MLKEREQLSGRVRVEAADEQRRARTIAGKDLVRDQRLGHLFGTQLGLGLAQRLRSVGTSTQWRRRSQEKS
jgi:hypothetical protein